MLVLRIKRLPHCDDLPLPAYETAGAAGLDLRAAVDEDAPVILDPGARALIPTGLTMQLPAGCEGQVRPRSGLAIRHGIGLVNAPGTIDEDYRGELMVPLINHGQDPFTVTRGMRIAQMIVAAVTRPMIEDVDELTSTGRGEAGFGSTGTG